MAFKYRLEELSDPILFEEMNSVLAALRPGEISWLATNRTLWHTKACVFYDFNLWKFHFYRILKELDKTKNEVNQKKDQYDTFLSAEIEQAAKDIKVLFKLANRDKLRFILREKLMALAVTFPVAQNIADSIEEPRKISPIIVVKNEARRYYTSAVRLYLSSLGIVPDKRKHKDKQWNKR